MSLRQLLKHLPGKHNQKLHNPHTATPSNGISSLSRSSAVGSVLSVDYGTIHELAALPQVSISLDTASILETSAMGRGVLSYMKGLAGYKDGVVDVKFTHIACQQNAPGVYEVIANIETPDRRNVGEITRVFDLNEGDVHHSWFDIKKQYQNSGFGLRFYHESEKAYMAAGFKTVTLTANMEVGGYAWARMGFDLDKNDAHMGEEGLIANATILSRVVQRYQSTYGTLPAKLPTTMPEAAVLTGPDGRRIGKLALLNIKDESETPYDSLGWVGIKRLDPLDINYRLGQTYYRSKGVQL